MPLKPPSRRFPFFAISFFALIHLASGATPLSPLLSAGKPVDWWFVFKFNAATFPGDESKEPTATIFGGTPTNYNGHFSLSYAYASSADSTLRMGTNYIGLSLNDPLGATFEQIYHGTCNYVLWNDQFYDDPMPTANSPWGHSKGALAWDDAGNGFVLQVSTPSWPASGSFHHPRASDGNTLGTIHDNDIKVSQHFFALKLNAADVATVLVGLANASIVTKPGDLQIFHAGGPSNLRVLAQQLGHESSSTEVMKQTLSSGVIFISKPSKLHVPVWQLVSAEMDGLPLRAATWWAAPKISSTTPATPIECWDAALGHPGEVQIATSGAWQGKTIGLKGGTGLDANHAKIGVSRDPAKEFCFFGDMNQQGTLDGDCASSQNGRGGEFYVLEESGLFQSLTALLAGDSAPVP
jgi:hypothetical protein